MLVLEAFEDAEREMLELLGRKLRLQHAHGQAEIMRRGCIQPLVLSASPFDVGGESDLCTRQNGIVELPCIRKTPASVHVDELIDGIVGRRSVDFRDVTASPILVFCGDSVTQSRNPLEVLRIGCLAGVRTLASGCASRGSTYHHGVSRQGEFHGIQELFVFIDCESSTT